MKKNVLYFTLLLLLPAFSFAQNTSLQLFPLSSVRLLESPFKQAQETDKDYVLALDPDRLLAPFLREAGLPPKAPTYGNWEGSGLDGHIGGHYLSALSNLYAATGDAVVLRRLNYMINGLEQCQQKNGNGYVGGIPNSRVLWQEIAAGKIEADGFSLNKRWVPWYNIHKLYAGLVDAYRIARNQKAKDILVKLSDWCLQLTSKLTEEQMQQILRSEHGGMNEAFADVAAITGDDRYLQLAKRFSHRRILAPLLQGKDSLTGMHANTQIPKVIGYKRVAEVGGEKAWADAAAFFWNTVVNNRTVSIGGNSVREHFHPAQDFSSMIESREGPETCNSYNMLKLTKQLFFSHPSVGYMDYYERTLYNHILSSQHPKGGFVYFTPMRPRHYRVYSQPEQGFWCCVGSGMENHGKYGEAIYAHNGKDILVNLFIPSILRWKEKGITLEQQTKFPFEETTQVKLTLERPLEFAVLLRYPSWVEKGGLKLKVNNREISPATGATGYVSINRRWKKGDVITVTLPMKTRAERLPDNSSWVSFVHGPVVLAAVTDTTGLVGLRADSSRMGHIANGPLYPIEEAPLIVASTQDLSSVLQPVKGSPMTFTVSKHIHPENFKDLKLEPFFQVHDARYVVYWPFATLGELEKRKEVLRRSEEAKLLLEAQTLDQVAPGEQQPESDHQFKGENTETGVFMDRHWRHATSWFSYDLKNRNNEARQLRITYFGGDSNRAFDIYVNGKKLATQKLDGTRGATFYDVDYELPQGLGETITVKFVAHPGSVAGGVYYVQLLK